MLHSPVFLAVDDESDGKDVVYAFERHLLLLHLLVYGQRGLRAYLQLVLYAFVRKLLLQRFNELRSQLLSVALRTLELVRDGPVLLGICMTEIYVLKLALDII